MPLVSSLSHPPSVSVGLCLRRFRLCALVGAESFGSHAMALYTVGARLLAAIAMYPSVALVVATRRMLLCSAGARAWQEGGPGPW